MRLFFLILIFIFFVVFGVIIYLKYYFRCKVTKDLIYISTYLKNNISYSKEKISSLLDKCFDSVSFVTKFLIKNEKIMCVIDNKLLSNMKLFFNSLGNGDVCYEIDNISYYENEFINYSKLCDEELKNKGVIYLKLIILLGVFVIIIIL